MQGNAYWKRYIVREVYREILLNAEIYDQQKG